MPVEVYPVTSRRELKEFIELPYRLHSTSQQWVPPSRLERQQFLSRRFNPFFRHGEARYFLARSDGRVVGRVSAHIDHKLNEQQGNRWGLFGFLELEDDPEVATALVEAAAAWLRARGRDRMVGPMDFTMNDESGVVVEGHDLAPMIRQPWQPPYYAPLCEGAGLEKLTDLLMWELHISDRDKMLPILPELAEKAETEHGVRIRRMTRRSLRNDLDIFAEVYNRAWRKFWYFTPYDKADLDGYALELQLVFDEDWFMVAEIDGEPVAIAITVPDVNQALRKMNGRLLPFAWWHYLTKKRFIDRVRVGFLGVKPEFQHTGVAARLYVEHFNTSARTPIKGGEMGWILEDNDAMNRGMEAMNGRVVKRYRVFQRVL